MLEVSGRPPFLTICARCIASLPSETLRIEWHSLKMQEKQPFMDAH
jgi:hypothetical protein